jgi:hypothetical protein
VRQLGSHEGEAAKVLLDDEHAVSLGIQPHSKCGEFLAGGGIRDELAGVGR